MIEIVIISIVVVLLVFGLISFNKEERRHNKILEDHLHFLDDEVKHHKNIIKSNNDILEDYKKLIK